MATDALTDLQGVPVASAVVDPDTFFANARRQRFNQYSSSSFQGLANADQFSIRQDGIVLALDVRLFGSVVVTLGAGTCGTTNAWPWNLLKYLTFSANGQNNLIKASGELLKLREIMRAGELSDRGVAEFIGGASPGTAVQQGTLAMASEAWGLGRNVSAIPSGTYNFELSYRVPVAYDLSRCFGAIFAQTSSTSLDLVLQWALPGDLFVLTGGATAVVSLGYTVTGVALNIPQSGGHMVVPDLSLFHTLQENNSNSVAQAASEIALTGTGVGRQLMAIMFKVLNGAAPQSPLVMNSTNFANVGWAYGGNKTPEVYPTGFELRHENERTYNTDVGALGWGVIDFAQHWAFRDSVDEGKFTNLRLIMTPSVALTNPLAVVAQETMTAGAKAA
jgi:hypothetical protein